MFPDMLTCQKSAVKHDEALLSGTLSHYLLDHHGLSEYLGHDVRPQHSEGPWIFKALSSCFLFSTTTCLNVT